VKLDSGNAVGIALRSSSDGTQGYALIIDQVDGVVKLASYPYIELASAPVNVCFQRTYALRLDAVGANFTAYLNGVAVFSATDSTYSSGYYGLFAYKSTSEFDNLLAKTSPILEQTFTGTSLSGWTANGGTWTNPGGLVSASTPGDAWNIYQATGTNFISAFCRYNDEGRTSNESTKRTLFCQADYAIVRRRFQDHLQADWLSNMRGPIGIPTEWLRARAERHDIRREENRPKESTKTPAPVQ
jgi:hypothetical protein